MTALPSERLPSKILLVDESDECREVLRTVLEQRGFRTIEAAEARRGLKMLQLHRPQLVVLDLDTEAAAEVSVRSDYEAETRDQQAELLLLGRLPRPDRSQAGPAGPPPGTTQIAKPYHFAPLIRTIEQLLGQ